MFIDRILQKTTVYDPWSSMMAYANSETEDGEKVEDSQRKIDIDAAGGFLLTHYGTEMQKAERRMPFVEDAVSILQDGDYAMSRVLRADLTDGEKSQAREVNWKTRTKEKFLATLLSLISIGLMAETSEKETRALTKHFQIPKGSDAWRVISDARIFNWMCDVPPGVNLPLIRNILIEVALLGCTYAVVADWRFWFYQLPINPALQQHFVMNCANQFIRMICLPMGWSWSPRIAQCIGWGVILHRAFVDDAYEDPLGVYEEWGADPPSVVKLRDSPGGSVVGLIFLWYDNVFIVCKDPALRDKWYDRLAKNCKRFNAKVKTMERTDKPNFLGIHFWTTKEGVFWCHESDRIKKWKKCLAAPIKTARDVSRLVGFAIWHCTVGLIPLLHLWDVINILRRVSRATVTKSSWDKPLEALGVVLSVEEQKLLKLRVRGAVQNPPFSTNLDKVSNTVYAAADACRDDVRADGRRVSGGGWLLYGKDFVPGNNDYLCERVDWNVAESAQAIHILETKAVLELLKWIPPSPSLCRLMLGEDNSIVVAAISKGYSSCQATCQVVKEILTLCKEKRYVIEVIWVPTKENAADPISRDEPADATRNERTWRILHGEAPLTAKKGKREREAPSAMRLPIPDHNPHAEELEVALCRLNEEEEL